MSVGPLRAQAPGLVPKLVRTARAGSDDPSGEVDRAWQAVTATRDPRKVQDLIAIMRRNIADLKRDGKDTTTAEARLQKAVERAAALPFMMGLPDLPKSKVGRNPLDSNSSPTSEDAGKARAFMAGYTGSGSAISQWLAKLPFLARFFPAAQATPAFQKLSAAQRAQFLDLAKTANATGQIALHDMLAKGKLTPSLLDALAGLANDRLAPRIDQRQLVSQALAELNDPVTISQKSRGTCAPTSVQMLIAIREPLVYVGLLRGLASPSGQARLAGGQTIQREPDWDSDNDGGRSIPSRLIQPALMEFANGEADYNNSQDEDIDPKTHVASPSGLDGPGSAALLGAVMEGKPTYVSMGVTYAEGLSADAIKGIDDNIETPRDLLLVLEDNRAIDAKAQDNLVAQLAAHATPDDPVYCTVIYTLKPSVGGVGFHAILVTGVKDDQVSFINPWGQEETLPVASFKRSIVSANLRQEVQVDQPAPEVGGKVKPASAPETYVVKPGDTLTKLAERYLGKASRWKEIAALNPELQRNPGKLTVGWTLRLPDRT